MFLVSRSNEDKFARNYPGLVPENEGEYILYSVGDEIDSERLEEEGIDIAGISYRESLSSMNEEYADLELEESPAYILFDSDGLVYKTYDYKELIQYLKENPES